MIKLLRNKKLISINIIILCLLLLTIPTLVFCYDNLKFIIENVTRRNYNPVIKYPVFNDKKTTSEVFNELNRTKGRYIYKPFIGWRSKPINLKHIRIEGRYNTRYSIGEKIENSNWFFGGSTMWGSFVSDKGTIPSIFNEKTKQPVFNFGETGWNSRQSLNQLINAIGDGFRPSAVVFYDGVNDVALQCRTEIDSIPSHSREYEIKDRLNKSSNFIHFILAPYVHASSKLNLKFSWGKAFSSTYDCDTNKSKAQSIAMHLISNWRAAYALSKMYDFEFYGILQPTLFSTQTNSDYLANGETTSHPTLKKQYNAVYPLVLQEIKSQCRLDKSFCSSIYNGT